jgi:ferredoxin
MIVVKSEQCPQNHKCPMVRACPKQAISQEGFAAPTVDPEKCISCGICTKNCPYRCFVKVEQ